MDFKKERGSATIEGAFIFPIILLLVFLFIGLGVFFYNQFLQLESSSYAIRRSAQNWYRDKSLYEDLLFDYDFSEVVEEKKKVGKVCFDDRLAPLIGGTIHQDYFYNNFLVWKSLVHKTVGSGGDNHFSYPVLTGSNYMRAADLTEEILNDAFQAFEEKEVSEKVYIVDDKGKETDYKKVYHLYRDCFYMRNGYKREGRKEEVRGEGFRCCRSCLGRKTGLDE